MATVQCPHCNSMIPTEAGQTVRFCPFCGKKMTPVPVASEPSDFARRVAAEKKPRKKYELILKALEAAPEDFEVNKALLYHGRLHEPMARGSKLDFSIIKSNLLSVFDTPGAYTDETLDAKYEELLRDPQLLKTMALSGDDEAFFIEYLHKMAFEYIDMFIRNDSRYANVAFGFSRSAESLAKKCGEPVRRMLMEIARTARLTERERGLLMAAVREGYARVFPGYAKYIEEQ